MPNTYSPFFDEIETDKMLELANPKMEGKKQSAIVNDQKLKKN